MRYEVCGCPVVLNGVEHGSGERVDVDADHPLVRQWLAAGNIVPSADPADLIRKLARSTSPVVDGAEVTP